MLQKLFNNNYDNWKSCAKNVDLFVTCEPCIMCASFLQQIGVKRCVFCCDNEKFGGCGTVIDVAKKCNADFEVYKGLFADRAVKIFQDFYSQGNINAPDEKRKRKLK